MPHLLILGGTTEASALATACAARGLPATLSYAGRTANPAAQAVPVRIGGFGGAAGLAEWMAAAGVTHLVDATHPFAAQISAHAVAAAARIGVPLVALTRPPWQAEAGDRWRHVADIPGAVAALAGPAEHVLLALGRMHVAAFATQPQHHYVLRFVDPPAERPVLPDHHLVVDRGPFTVAGDRALIAAHGIQRIVCKNAGGSGARAKLVAARELGVPVLMIDRPVLPERAAVDSVAAVFDWLADHDADRGV
ncbi:precorrin-6A/cobalt-precorrin-6A reductase [Sphingomonas sp. SORGH_AS802]|uniref:cobalt-precorrin-6A reductase n=1 Tax=unclassified Sphingomonas TaxID=196159 RepID=UPI00285F7BAB|nr:MULTISPECIES: cobalt-precorrin-6A reductase [unclassified Sphingomonas]MDR6128611.1 precorrin-6A/cobalt-precorrin-6A reductase [Sphingomonas sp. SORGH_AS_0438]MDR6135193.1 precorrin-6A/cobalt-precorrin-6A reductase [Sphingomonas sp. SORGH_AS_0802]